jgi:DNA adenine methylase
MEKKKYIKSLMNFSGGKYKLLDKILPIFPKEAHMFVDLFGGGMNVAINTENYKNLIYNDIDRNVVSVILDCWLYPHEIMVNGVDYYIEKYGLSKTNVDGYNQMRKDFNNKDYGSYFRPIMLFALTCYSFNYQIRFNKKGEFNMPFGKNRSSFNDSIRERVIAFCDRLDEFGNKLTIWNKNYVEAVENLLISQSGEDVFFYCDPPYLNSVATYNENGGWTEENEIKLLEVLDCINAAGMKFALSNNLKYDNQIIEKWRKKYNTHYINADYSNCNYQKKDRSKDCEVLITNY